MPSIRKSPWAKLMIFMTPKIRVRPRAISAKTPPISRPLTIAWAMADSMGSS
jgi:hypothetical protein